jgi:hypothetical protein
MKALLTGLLAATVVVGACGPREVDVRTAPQTQTDAGVHVTNNLTQSVNVYVVSGGTEIFLGQVPAQSAQHLSAGGVASGSNVTLRARTADGSRTYTRDNVMLTGTYSWQVP